MSKDHTSYILTFTACLTGFLFWNYSPMGQVF